MLPIIQVQYIFIPLIGLVLLVGGLLIVIFSLRSAKVDEVTKRLNMYVVEPVELNKPRVELYGRGEELKGSFSQRVLLPVFKGITRIFGRLTPAKTLDELSHQLTIAGNPFGLGAREFYGLRLIFLILGLWVAFSMVRNGLTQTNAILAGMSLLIAAYLPKQWLKGRVRKRQNAIRRGLPDALDMLSVCAEAGLGFDQALQRVSEHWKTAVSAEFGRVVAEMEMGVARRVALRSLADRWDLNELSTFVTVIIQSEQLGMSISETLSTQAKQMREERRFRFQEAARKVPLKMLFPMMLLIFPSLYAVILGPAIPRFMDFFSGN